MVLELISCWFSLLATIAVIHSRLKEGLRPLMARLKTRKSQLNNLEAEVKAGTIKQLYAGTAIVGQCIDCLFPILRAYGTVCWSLFGA